MISERVWAYCICSCCYVSFPRPFNLTAGLGSGCCVVGGVGGACGTLPIHRNASATGSLLPSSGHCPPPAGYPSGSSQFPTFDPTVPKSSPQLTKSKLMGAHRSRGWERTGGDTLGERSALSPVIVPTGRVPVGVEQHEAVGPDEVQPHTSRRLLFTPRGVTADTHLSRVGEPGGEVHEGKKMGSKKKDVKHFSPKKSHLRRHPKGYGSTPPPTPYPPHSPRGGERRTDLKKKPSCPPYSSAAGRRCHCVGY